MAVITKSDVASRYATLVTNWINAQVVWGSNNKPFGEFVLPEGTDWGGTTSGIPLSTLTLAAYNADSNVVTADDIFNLFIDETSNYTNLRYVMATLFVEGGGGNTGTRSTPGVIFNEMRLAHLDSGYKLASIEDISVDENDRTIFPESIISETDLEDQFRNFRDRWTAAASADMLDVYISVCHASCHSSCHGSRGRR